MRDPRHSEAECELARALLLTGRNAEARSLLARSLSGYKAWVFADPAVVDALNRLDRR